MGGVQRAFARRVIEVAAGAGFIAAASMKRAGKVSDMRRARDGDRAVFERLAHNFEHVARELGQLVQKEHAVMREADLARARDRAAADQPRVGDGVVRRAERAVGDQTAARIEHAGHGVDLGGLERLLERERRRIDGRRLASMVLPEPGGPIIRML